MSEPKIPSQFQPRTQPPEKPAKPAGPGWGSVLVFALVGFSMFALLAGMFFFEPGDSSRFLPKSLARWAETGVPPNKQRKAPVPRKDVFAAPAVRLAPPVKVRPPRKKFNAEAGSVGMVKKNRRIKRVADPYLDLVEKFGRGGNPEESITRVTSRGPAVPSRGAVSFKGADGYARLRLRVIRSRKSWRALLRSVGGRDMPDPDFRRKMAVVVFAGSQPEGSTVDIVSAKPSKGRFRVSYRIHRARARRGAGSVRPYHIVLVKRSRLKPLFKKIR